MPKIDLPRLAAMVFNTPLMMDRSRLDTALRAVGPRILDGLDIEPQPDASPPKKMLVSDRRYFNNGGYMHGHNIGVLPILGTMSRRATWLDAYCGMTSYQAIANAAYEILMDGQVRGLMLELDTGGGEAGGCFDTAELIMRISEETGKPVWAHANEAALSAGYALACSASKIWLARTAEVGSIGVVAAHVDVSEADKKAGVQWTYIYAGDKKIDGNPHEPLSDDARTEFQEDVDGLAQDFYHLVSSNRGLEVEEVRAMQAGIFRGAKAVEVKLADNVGTFDEAMQAFADEIDETQTSGSGSASLSTVRSQLMANSNRTAPKANAAPGKPDEEKDEGKKPETETKADGEKDEEGEDEGKDKPKPTPPAAEVPADPVAAANAAERTRCSELSGIAKQASRLGVDFDLSAAINGGVSADAARKSIMDKSAEADTSRNTVSTTPGAQQREAVGKEATRTAWGKALKRR